MNPSPISAGFETHNPPVFNDSIDDRLATAMSYSRRSVSQILRKYPHDVDDVLQNASIQAFVHIQSFRADADFNTWFCRIAINEALMHLRKFRNGVRKAESMTDMESILFITATTPTPEDQVLNQERRAVLAKMILRLTPTCRRETLAVIAEKPREVKRQTREKAAFHHAKVRLRKMCGMDFTRGLFAQGGVR